MNFKTKNEGINHFKKLGYKIKEGPNWFIVIPKKEEIYNEEKIRIIHPKERKTCLLCGSSFKFGSCKTNFCICKLFILCENEKCNTKYFESLNRNNILLQKINNNEIIKANCSNDCRIISLNKFIWRDENYENMKEISKNNMIKAREKKDYLRENDPEYREKEIIIALNGLKKANEYWENHKEQQINHLQKLVDDQLKEMEKGTELGIKFREVRINNGKKTIHFALEAIEELRKTDEEWNKRQTKINIENIKKARLFRLNKLEKLFEENPIKFNNKFISYDDLQKLKQNDICGSWVIRAKFKAYKGTERENERFRLGPFKAKEVYDEMSWAGRVIKQPEKQDWIITEQNPWNIAKWWYISNLYYDFEFELITDENGVTEEEALIAEAAYASKYDLFVEFTEDKEGRKIPIVEKHAYWSP